jgi:two-component system response regulator DesR
MTPPDIPDGAIRLLIVDGHVTTRIGMGVLLQREPWVDRCLLARDSGEGAELARRHRPAVALLDVSNAGPFVASSTAALREAHPAVQIVLTSRCTSHPGTAPSELGATSFLAADASSQDIVATIRAAVMAQRPDERPPPAGGAAHLSDHERQLLALMSTGATNKEIAGRLHLGPDGVKKRASALYRKLGVRNRTEAAQRAAQLLTGT